MSEIRRGKKYIDGEVQGTLIYRTLIHWLVIQFTLAFILLAWTAVSLRPDSFTELCLELWVRYGPVAIASVLLLPIILFDVVHTSNRFAGPMYRIRNTLKSLAKGQATAKLSLRENDFWSDVAADVNVVAERLETLRHDSAELANVLDEDPATDPASVLA